MISGTSSTIGSGVIMGFIGNFIFFGASMTSGSFGSFDSIGTIGSAMIMSLHIPLSYSRN
jgi:hypothetical protein